MEFSDIQNHLEENSKDLSSEFKRLFHGRGGLYEGFKHLCIDSIDTVLSVALYDEEKDEAKLIEMLEEFVKNSRHKSIVLQRRYLKGSPSEVLAGELPQDLFVMENGIKIKLTFLQIVIMDILLI